MECAESSEVNFCAKQKAKRGEFAEFTGGEGCPI